MAYDIGTLPLETLIRPVARATEVLVRLDERLARSPVADGWIERSHFHDAAAALWVEGELVHLEDLVFHDAEMDLRTPTHELTRAHMVLRMRRRMLSRPRDWALGREGLRELTGVGRAVEPGGREGEGEHVADENGEGAAGADDDDPLAAEFAAIDALLERSNRLLEGAKLSRPVAPAERSPLVYDLDWDEDGRLTEWQTVLDATRDLPAIARAAVLLDAWDQIEVLQRGAWVGPLLVAAQLRQEGVAGGHLAALHLGARAVPREKRRARGRTDRLLAWIDTIYEAASAGLKEHDRLTLAREQLERRLRNRRASSKLPDLVELVLSRPLVSATLVQKRLKVSRQGALNLVGELGLREMTGRVRYRAWGIV